MIDRRTVMGALAALAGSPAVAAPEKTVVELALRYTLGVLWAPVMIDGSGPHRFFVHTGQTFFNISRKLAESLDLRRKNVGEVIGHTPKGRLELDVYVAREFLLGNAFRLENVELVARDYQGEEVFSGTVPYLPAMPMTFDFEAWKLLFHRDGFTPPEGAARVKLLRPPAGAISTIPVMQAELDGHRLRLGINTGSAHPLTLHPSTVRRLKLWDRYPASLTSARPDAEFGEFRSRTARAGVLRMAGVDIERPVVLMGDPSAGRGVMLESDGSIGIDILRRFRLAFDPKQRAAWFLPNAERMREPFFYDRSGLDTQRTEDGGAVVVQVLPNSPAEKAGLRVGDRLPSVSPEEATAREFGGFGRPGSTREVVVERDGGLRTLRMTLEELI